MFCHYHYFHITVTTRGLECSNYCSTSLLSVVGKVLLSIIRSRIKDHWERRTIEQQAGFCGCADQIFCLRQVLELRIISRQKFVAIFVNFWLPLTVCIMSPCGRQCLWMEYRPKLSTQLSAQLLWGCRMHCPGVHLRWFGHVCRMDDCHLLKQLLWAERLDGWRCPLNAPKKQWKDLIAVRLSAWQHIFPGTPTVTHWRRPPAWLSGTAHGGGCNTTSPASTDVGFHQAGAPIQMSRALLDKRRFDLIRLEFKGATFCRGANNTYHCTSYQNI